MKHLATFLTRLQTFELRIIQKTIYKGTGIGPGEKTEIPAYDLQHETQYYDSFTFKSELRVGKDMALIDLLTLDETKTRAVLAHIMKLQDRFKLFWQNYHRHYSGYEQVYKSSYLFSIRLEELFIVHNLQPDHAGIWIGEEFVENLSDSVKLREKFLKDFIREVEEHLNAQDGMQSAGQSTSVEKKGSDGDTILPASRPKFSEGAADQLFAVLKTYFDRKDHPFLQALLSKDQSPQTPMLFRGNGNQLADAFKQLYEANMIVGCSKAELERWIAPNFLYQYNKLKKEFTEGYLNGIISSDSKPCRSPILEVKMKDGRYTIFPTPRNKKNNKY